MTEEEETIKIALKRGKELSGKIFSEETKEDIQRDVESFTKYGCVQLNKFYEDTLKTMKIVRKEIDKREEEHKKGLRNINTTNENDEYYTLLGYLEIEEIYKDDIEKEAKQMNCELKKL